MRVLLIGVRKSIIEQYLGVFQELGIEPALIETQMISIMRSLQFKVESPTTMVVDFGASGITLAIVRRAELQFVIYHAGGSQLLTKSLEKAVGLSSAQAEEYKRAFGLNDKQLEGKVKVALLPMVNEFVGQMIKATQFYAGSHPQERVERIILTGGASLLPELVQLIATQLGVEVILATPITNVAGDTSHKVNEPAMSVGTGLLMRNL